MRDKQDCVILACCCLYVCEAGHVISGVVLCFLQFTCKLWRPYSSSGVPRPQSAVKPYSTPSTE